MINGECDDMVQELNDEAIELVYNDPADRSMMFMEENSGYQLKTIVDVSEWQETDQAPPAGLLMPGESTLEPVMPMKKDSSMTS